MTPALAHIVRHPIKSVGWEELGQADLAPNRTLPFDREWAVAHAAARLDDDAPAWAPKLNFVRGWASPDLMAVRAVTDEAARRVTLSHPAAEDLTVAPDDPRDAARLVEWLRPLWPENRPEAAKVIRVPGQAMTDQPDPLVSVLNLSSNRALGQRLGRDLSIHRWRGNLWIEGLAPWEEFDLIGRHIRIGTAVLRVDERIARCRATMANPDTGRVDADTLGALEAGYGHQDFGVFATVVEGGHVRLGDPVELS